MCRHAHTVFRHNVLSQIHVYTYIHTYIYIHTFSQEGNARLVYIHTYIHAYIHILRRARLALCLSSVEVWKSMTTSSEGLLLILLFPWSQTSSRYDSSVCMCVRAYVYFCIYACRYVCIHVCMDALTGARLRIV